MDATNIHFKIFATAMFTLYKSLAIQILEYCSIQWNPPYSVGFIQRIEEIQKTFLKKIKIELSYNMYGLI